MASNLNSPDDLQWGQENVRGKLTDAGIILGATQTISGGSPTSGQVVTAASGSTKIKAGVTALSSSTTPIATGFTTLTAVVIGKAGGASTFASDSNLVSVTLSAGSTAGAFTILSFSASTTQGVLVGIGASGTGATCSWIAVGL